MGRLSANDKKRIEGLLLDPGLSVRAIAKRVGRNHSVIARYIERRGRPQRVAKPGRLLAGFTERFLCRAKKAKAEGQTISMRGKYAAWRHQNKPSLSTVRRYFRSRGIVTRRPVRRTILEGKDYTARVKWAKGMVKHNAKFWRNVLHYDTARFKMPLTRGQYCRMQSSGMPYEWVEGKAPRSFAQKKGLAVGCGSYHLGAAYFRGRFFLLDLPNKNWNAMAALAAYRKLRGLLRKKFPRLRSSKLYEDNSKIQTALAIRQAKVDLGLVSLPMAVRSPDASIMDRAVFLRAKKEILLRLSKRKKWPIRRDDFKGVLRRTFESRLLARVADQACASQRAVFKSIVKNKGQISA